MDYYDDQYLVEADMAEATEEEVRQEATRRLSLLASMYGLGDRIVERWEKGFVCCSSETIHGLVATSKHTKHCDLTPNTQPAIMIAVPKYSQLADVIREFEWEHRCVVYYVVQNAHFLSFLYVSPYKEEWEHFEELELEEGLFTVYVHNLFFSEKSDLGNVRLGSLNGVLVRIV